MVDNFFKTMYNFFNYFNCTKDKLHNNKNKSSNTDSLSSTNRPSINVSINEISVSEIECYPGSISSVSSGDASIKSIK